MQSGTKSPIIGVYILSSGGIPALARHYYDKIPENEAILLGGFLSAIEIFARSSMNSSITDIGVQSRRFFFDSSTDEYITVILTETDISDEFISSPKYALVKLIQWRLTLVLDIIQSMTDTIETDILNIIKDLGPTIDSIVLECSLENIEIGDPLDIETSLHGVSIDDNLLLDTTLHEKIRELIDP